MSTYARERHPAMLYRDTMTGGAPAATSASLLTKKSITKGQRSFYYLNTDNCRSLPWWFLMRERTKTPTYRNSESWGTRETHSSPSVVFLDIHGSSEHPFSPPLFLHGLVTFSFPLRLCSAPHALHFPLPQLLQRLLPAPALHCLCRDWRWCQPWNGWEIFTSQLAHLGTAPLSQTQGVTLWVELHRE